MRNKALFKTFENADSETIKVLSGYIGMENDAVKKRIFRKSMEKYLQRTSDSEILGKNYARISDVTEAKRTGRALRIVLSGVAAACAVAVGVWVIRPMLNGPDTVNNGYTVNSGTEKQRELWTAVPPDQASKEDIFWLMMNSIFYYDKVSGSIYVVDDDDKVRITDFQCCLSEDKYYYKLYKVSIEDTGALETEESVKSYADSHTDLSKTELMYREGDRYVTANYDGNNGVIKSDVRRDIIDDAVNVNDIKTVPDSERMVYENGKVSQKSLYPSPFSEADDLGEMLFPQKLAAYSMSDMDKWYTDSIVNVNGRECYHILLSVTGYNAENDIGLKNTEIWVDVKTGVVMKMLLSDVNGKAVVSMYTDGIHFDDEAIPVTDADVPEDVIKEIALLKNENDEAELYERISEITKELAEVDDEMERLNDLSEDEKRESMARLSEQRAALQEMLDELNANKEKLDELNEDYNEQLKRLNELKKQYGNKTAENTAPRKLDKAVSPEKATKKDVYHLLLNSIDYYDKASGTVYCPVGNNFDMASKIEFQTILSESKAYQHYTSYYIDDMKTYDMASIKEISKRSIEGIDDMEFFCDVKNNICISSNNISKEYENTDCFITMDNVVKIEDDERVTVETDGQPCYLYRTDPTNVPDASSVCLFAQGLTMGYLQDFKQWDIKGTAKYEDKECFCISGTASKEYGAGHNVATFDFWVDAKTGVLLQYAGYDENGNIRDYIYTENIAFDNSALDVKNFSESFIEGYKPFG